MKKTLTAFLLCACVGLTSANVWAGKRLNLTNVAFEEIGSPMWVVARDGSTAEISRLPEGETSVARGSNAVEGASVRPFRYAEAVQSNYSGYIVEHLSGKTNIIDVNVGDVLVRHYRAGKSVAVEKMRLGAFVDRFVMSNGAEIEVPGVRTPTYVPEVSARAEAKLLLQMLSEPVPQGVDYALVPEKMLQNIVLEHLKDDGPSKLAEYRLAPQEGYLITDSGKKAVIERGALLKYQEGKIVSWVNPEYYRGLVGGWTGRATKVLSRDYPKLAWVMERTIYTKDKMSLEGLLQEFLRENKTEMEKYKPTKGLPMVTPGLLEGYLRYQESMDAVREKFGKRHSLDQAGKQALLRDIEVAKEARAQTRMLLREHSGEFTEVLKGRLSRNVRSGLKIENLLRRISHGSLLTAILVVGGMEAVEGLLARLDEEDHTADNAAALTRSVQQRDAYLNAVKNAPELLVYMPSNVMHEAVRRNDFDQVAMGAELYLFNQFLAQAHEDGTTEEAFLERVLEEYAQAQAAYLAEETLVQAARS